MIKIRTYIYVILLLTFSLAANAAITQGTFAGTSISSWSYPNLVNDAIGNTYLMVKVASSDIRILKYDGSSWTTHTSFSPAMINADANFSNVSSIGSDFDIAVDANNNLHIGLYFYKSSEDKRGVLYGYHNGTSWDFELIEEHYHTGGWISAREPRIIIDNNNYPHIIYEYSDVDGTREYAIRHRHKKSGSWSSYTNIHTWSGTVDTGLHEVFLQDVYLHTNNNLYCYFGYDNAANTSPDIFLSIFNNTNNTWSAKTEVIDGVTSDIYHSIQGQFIEGSDIYLGFLSSNNTANVKKNSNAPSSSAITASTGKNFDRFRSDGSDYYFMINQVTEEWDDNWENVTMTGSVYLKVFDGTNWHPCDPITALNDAAGCNESTFIIRPDGKIIMIFSNYDENNTLKYAVGSIVDFLPSNCFTPSGAAIPPTMGNTTVVSSITSTTATSGGNITSNNGNAVTTSGVCWNTATTPTIANSKSTDGDNDGAFTSNLTGLSSNTLYYVRSYATNAGGTSYGTEVTFRTLAIVPNAPTVNNASATTLDVTLAVDGNNAATTFAIQETSTGDYVQAGGALGAAPVWQNNATWSTVTVTGLTRYTEYTFQVKARNSDNVETAFGSTKSETTLQDVPTLASTTEITDNVGTTASSGGNISDNGGSAITVRGVCWNTTGTPTTADDKTSDGTGTGIFTSNITGLTPDETYYVRAYATNGIGTVYGNQLSFTTPNDPPVLAAISPASSITESSAETGCEITDGGTTVVTVRGVCWNTTGTPTTADDKTSDGTGTGVFSSSIEGLDPNTTYHVRAYATNGGGTTYSNETSFTTLNLSVAISNFIKNTDTEYELTADITNPSSIQITAKGYVWSTSQNPTTTLNSGSTSNGTGDASFTDNATVTIGPGYYVRAYITTAGGTYYSDAVHFGVVPTLPEWGLIFLAAGFVLGGGWFAFRKMW